MSFYFTSDMPVKLVPQPSDGRDMESAGYTQTECTSCKGAGRLPGVRHTVTCGRCSGYGHLFTREPR